MNKVYSDVRAALDGLLHDGMLIAAGGFGPGTPASSDRSADTSEAPKGLLMHSRLKRD